MASYYFGINVGAGVTDGVTEGSSSTSKDVEVVINTTANVPDREQLALAAQTLVDYIMGKAAKNW